MKLTMALSILSMSLAATIVEAAPGGATSRLQSTYSGAPFQVSDSFRGKDRKCNQTASAAADQLQSNLNLDPGQVQPGLSNDGRTIPSRGQVASLTSTNNFINYCATRPDLPLTNGQQILTGSCNPTIMGEIIAKDKMPSAKIISPPNFSTVKASQAVTFRIKVRNLQTGNFVNAQDNYFAAPQQTNPDGILIAHSHITVNNLTSYQDTEPTDPQDYAFFQSLNDKAVDGILSTDATDGFAPGFYRACTINTAANHQPALVAVAQHGALDDCTYFQVTVDGQRDGSADAAGTSTDTAAETVETSNGHGGKDRGRALRDNDRR